MGLTNRVLIIRRHLSQFEEGRQTSVIDPLGRETDQQYDSDGRVIRTIFADFSFITVGYDAVGNKIRQTDQNGRTTLYSYNAGNSPGALTIVLHACCAYSRNRREHGPCGCVRNRHVVQSEVSM